MDHPSMVQNVLAWTLTGAVVFTVVVTCASLVGWIRFEDKAQQSKLFGVLIVELVVVAVAFFAGFIKFSPPEVSASAAHVVPQPESIDTVPQFAEIEAGAFSLLRDIMIYDLRSWRPVEQGDTARTSPVSVINYLHVVKNDPNAKWFRAHYATSGAAIDLRSITHPARVRLQDAPVAHEGQRVKEYEIALDVADAPVGEEFLVVIEGTYWNGFRDPTQGDASTYTDADASGLRELVLVALFPGDKPARSHELFSGPTGGDDRLIPNAQAFVDRAGRFIYWPVENPRDDYHYTILWKW